jgi:hypothetical protein
VYLAAADDAIQRDVEALGQLEAVGEGYCRVGWVLGGATLRTKVPIGPIGREAGRNGVEQFGIALPGFYVIEAVCDGQGCGGR